MTHCLKTVWYAKQDRYRLVHLLVPFQILVKRGLGFGFSFFVRGWDTFLRGKPLNCYRNSKGDARCLSLDYLCLVVSGLNVQSSLRKNLQQHRRGERMLMWSDWLKIDVWEAWGVRANFPNMETDLAQVAVQKHCFPIPQLECSCFIKVEWVSSWMG